MRVLGEGPRGVYEGEGPRGVYEGEGPRGVYEGEGPRRYGEGKGQGGTAASCACAEVEYHMIITEYHMIIPEYHMIMPEILCLNVLRSTCVSLHIHPSSFPLLPDTSMHASVVGLGGGGIVWSGNELGILATPTS